MSKVFSLDSIRQEATKKFAPVKIGLSDESEVTLVSLLRLESDDRKVVSSALGVVNSIDQEDDSPEALEPIIEAISKIFNVIADKPAKLLRELDDPDLLVKLTMMSQVLTLWASETQLGEAQNSPA